MPEEAPPPPGGEELGALLLGEAEAYDWGAVANLDAFFTRIYRWVGTCRVQRERREGRGSLHCHLQLREGTPVVPGIFPERHSRQPATMHCHAQRPSCPRL